MHAAVNVIVLLPRTWYSIRSGSTNGAQALLLLLEFSSHFFVTNFRGICDHFYESSKACDMWQNEALITPPPKKPNQTKNQPQKPGARYLDDLIFKTTRKLTAHADTFVNRFLFQLPFSKILLTLLPATVVQ